MQKKRIALLYFNTKSNFIRTNKNTKNHDNFIISSITNKQKLKSERKKKMILPVLFAIVLIIVLVPFFIFACAECDEVDTSSSSETSEVKRPLPEPRKPVGPIFQNDLEEISENVAFHVIENNEDNKRKPYDADFDVPADPPEGFITTKSFFNASSQNSPNVNKSNQNSNRHHNHNSDSPIPSFNTETSQEGSYDSSSTYPYSSYSYNDPYSEPYSGYFSYS